jgi:hypothetical protein
MSFDLTYQQVENEVLELTEEKLRSFTLAICQYAIEFSELDNVVISNGLNALKKGEYGKEDLIQQLQDEVDRLDEKQWDIQNEVEKGTASEEEHEKAFDQARAANAVLSALDKSAKKAAIDALYEVHTAIRLKLEPIYQILLDERNI